MEEQVTKTELTPEEAQELGQLHVQINAQRKELLELVVANLSQPVEGLSLENARFNAQYVHGHIVHELGQHLMGHTKSREEFVVRLYYPGFLGVFERARFSCEDVAKFVRDLASVADAAHKPSCTGEQPEEELDEPDAPAALGAQHFTSPQSFGEFLMNLLNGAAAQGAVVDGKEDEQAH